MSLTATLRCTALWLGASAATVVAVASTRAEVGALLAGRVDDAEQVVVGVSAAAVVACAAWAWLVTTAVVLETASVVRAPLPAVPAGVRRVLLGACGVAVATGLGASAQAADGGSSPSPSDAAGAGALHGLPYPDRAHGGAPAARDDVGWVTVRPGDTLWCLAADLLPGTAPDAAVDRVWRKVHRWNRSTIGPDPDLLHPGQRLRVPR